MAHAHAELVGEQVFEHDLLQPGDARGVDLHDLEAARLQILLVHDAVLHLLAGGDRDRVDGALSTAPMAMCSTPDGHVLDALFRAEPAQLRVVDEHVPCGAHVVEQVLDVAADEHAGERVDASHDHVVATADSDTADSENEAAAAQAAIRVGGDDDVCRG